MNSEVVVVGVNSRFDIDANSGIVVGKNSNVVIGNLKVGANLGFNAVNSGIFGVNSMIVVGVKSGLLLVQIHRYFVSTNSKIVVMNSVAKIM